MTIEEIKKDFARCEEANKKYNKKRNKKINRALFRLNFKNALQKISKTLFGM